MTEINISLRNSLSESVQNSLASAPDNNPNTLSGQTCITCSDEGRPVTITKIWQDGCTANATAEPNETTHANTLTPLEETIDISLIQPVSPGDKVLVHAGMAIAKVQNSNER